VKGCGGDFHMRRHSQGVHPGVRAAGSAQGAGSGKKAFQTTFHQALNARSYFLGLPALIMASVIGDDQFQLDGSL
jgi:hypothetical protein